MTDSMTAPTVVPRRTGRSVLAVFLGFVVVFVLSLGTDQLFHVLGLVLCLLGAIAMIPKELGPAWYPIALTISAVPTSWLGGVLFMHRRAQG